MSSTSESVVLPRGGVLLPTSTGWLQYGAVPETIKDTMLLADGVPSLYVVPQRLFDPERGISVAELEFPCYFNFFIKGARTTLVCRPGQRQVLEQVLGQAVFGPSELDASELRATRGGGPDLLAEMNHFRRNPKRGGEPMQLSDLVEFVEFDSGGGAELPGGATVRLEDDGGISVHERGVLESRWRGEPPLPPRKPLPEGARAPFSAPLLGVSVIGAGHGFDPGNRTSGFILWVGGQGVLVDPPVDSVDWLRGYDISSKQVNSLILTHCHADHDAGTLQKILEEGRITIYTTPTVMRSFVAKYSALLGMAPEAFGQLFDHVPVQTGHPVYLNGAEATFRYSLHSIPCVGFDVRLGDRSIVYPSDTLNEPRAIESLHEQGVLNDARRDELLNFPWHHTLVIHEAGIPPIHTPVEYLATLDEDIKRRTLLVHVSQKSVPPSSGLQIAPTGLENTINLGAARLPLQGALTILDALARVDIFSELTAPKVAEFLRMVKKEVIPAGEKIVAEGSRGDRFYMILSGHAAVWKDGREFKVYSSFDYFGETALILDQPRVADVYAKTPMEVLVLERTDFLHLLRGTDLSERLIRLARMRELPSWELLVDSPVFRDLSSSQKTQLQPLMEPVELADGEVVGQDPILIESGSVTVFSGEHSIATLEAGGFAGDAVRLSQGSPDEFGFRVALPVAGFRFQRDGLRKFLKSNPGCYLQLTEVATGWEGLAHAARVHARATDD